MKKFLAMLLAALMLLSCMTVVSLADESATDGTEAEPAPVILPIGDLNIAASTNGWSNSTKEAKIGEEDVSGTEATGIPLPKLLELEGSVGVGATYTGELNGNGGWSNPAGNGTYPTSGIKLDYTVAEDISTEADAYDLTGMNFLIFDLYISDPAAVEGKEFYLELTSGGKCDVEESSWRKTLEQLKGSPIEAGWNHFELDLTSFSTKNYKGTFNFGAWNYMRLYNRDAINAGEGLTLAFKDMHFAATTPAIEAAKAAAAPVIELYQPIAEIGKGDITADNYETVKAQLAAANEAYNTLDSAAQNAVNDVVNTGSINRTLEKAFEAYEESLTLTDPVDPDPVDPVDPDPVDPDPVDPDPVDPVDPAPVDPVDPADEGGLKPVVIVVIVVVAVAVIAAVVIILIKKKK